MITTNNITKKYGDFTAINDLSFNVNEGEILCLLGANGAGKSTIINILLNFTLPTLGTAEINNLDVIKNPIKTKEFLTYIPENLMLYPTLSAVENLDYFTKLSNKTFDQQQLQNFLSEAGLEKAAHNNRVNTLSKVSSNPSSSTKLIFACFDIQKSTLLTILLKPLSFETNY